MPPARRSASVAVLALFAWAWAVAPAVQAAPPGRGSSSPGLAILTDVNETSNLVHWVDNLAGTSFGKTAPVYRRYWQERFGGFDIADRAALEAFARVRNLSLPNGAQVANASGCLPLDDGTLEWPQRFMAEAMRARSVAKLLEAVSDQLDTAAMEDLGRSLEHFAPRFHKVWRDMKHVTRFERRFERFMEDSDLAGYLGDLARFFDVAGAALPPMHISFIALPANGATHAEADGDRLLIEIRPDDSPADQISVVAHEAAHFLMRRMTPLQTDGLARQIFAAGDAGGLTWSLMWESLPTALGQGLARARIDPRRFAPADPWYHVTSIDRFAKTIYPTVAEAMKREETIHDGLMPRLVEMMQRSGLAAHAGMGDLLAPAFFAAGEGMDVTLGAVGRRLGVGHDATSRHFDLDGTDGDEWLRHYACVPGLVMVSAEELPRAARLGDERLLGDEEIGQVRSYLAEGRAGVLAVGHRRAGGVVFFLVPREARLAEDLASRFTRLRGMPTGTIPFGTPSPQNGRPVLGPGNLPNQRAPEGKMLY